MARYALVVGITQYDYPYNFSNLRKPANDAEAVARLLDERGNFQKINRLPEGWNQERGCSEVAADRLTSKQLEEAFQIFLEEVGQGEALIYFSGHGYVVADKLNKRQNRKKGYLVTSDSQIETIATFGIPFDSLNNLIRDSNLSRLVLLLDCCHAGSYLERDLVEQTLTAFGSQKDYYLIASCRSSEKAYEGEPEQENSIFTEALLEGLAQESADRDGQISCDRLFDSISKSKKLRNFGQQPIRLGLGGSITLVTYPVEHQEPVSLNRHNPYQGLSPFGSEQANYFYGREEAIRALLSRLTQNRFLSVIGPSGCGKSSLVKAGLLPQLRSDRLPGSSKWEIESFTPGKHPLTPLLEILARQHRQNQPYVLFIDQFEEIFTLCENEEERRTFIQLMTNEATNEECLARVIVAIRGDFLDRCAAYPEAATLINSTEPRTYIVTPLSRQELEEAIEKPAEQHGVMFERGLVSQIAEDVENQPGALPLLQYALNQLWRVGVEKSSSEQPQLTKKSYEKIGGVKGALNETANNLYQTRSPEDQAFIRNLFMQLVQVEKDKETRRPISWERLEAIADSPEQWQRVVGLLADQRLLVTDEKNVQVTHEALLSEWALLRSWIEENREDIRLSRRLEAYCRDWQERFNQSDNALLPDAWLAPIADWVNRTQPKLLLLEGEYLQKSIEKRDQDIQEKLEAAKREVEARAEAAEAKADVQLAQIEKSLEAEARAKAEARAEAARAKEAEASAKVQKQRTKFAIAAGVLVAFTLGLGLLAQQLETQKKQRESIAVGALISKSEQLFDNGNQLEALIASLQALKELNNLDGENTNALARLRRVIDGVQERNRIEGHTNGVNSVSFSPKDQLIASGSSDKTVRLWNPDGAPIKTPAPMTHLDKVWTVNFSPNGEYIASASADRRVKLWKKDGSLLTTLKGHEADVYNVGFSPDSKTIVSASGDQTIRLWSIDISSPKVLIKSPIILKGHKGRVWGAEFSSDGKLIASASDDKSIKIWNKYGELIATLKGHTGGVRYATFGSDNKSIISVSGDNSLRIWKWNNTPKYYTSKIISESLSKAFIVRFSHDYKLIAANSSDGTIKLWEGNNGKPLPSIGRHKDSIYDLSFHPDSKTIVSASRDGTIRIWSLKASSHSNSKADTSKLFKKGCSLVDNFLKTNHNAQTLYRDVVNFCKG